MNAAAATQTRSNPDFHATLVDALYDAVAELARCRRNRDNAKAALSAASWNLKAVGQTLATAEAELEVAEVMVIQRAEAARES